MRPRAQLGTLPGGAFQLSTQQASALQRSLQPQITTARGAVPSEAFRAAIVNDFSPERLQEAYSVDALWAGAGVLNDARRAGRCGGGGCNAPSCAFQAWDIALPCNEQNLQAFMFQLPRFVWAKNRLAQLYATPPEHFHLMTNRSIAVNASAWGVWLDEVYKAIGLLRWSANVRWELVTSKITLPFEWDLQAFGYGVTPGFEHPLWGMPRADIVAGAPLLGRFFEQGLKFWTSAPVFAQTMAPTMLMESPLTWAYQQAGREYWVDCCGYNRECDFGSGNPDHGGDVRALAWPLRVPQAPGDFAPHYGYWERNAAPTMPAMPIASAGGRRIAYEFQCAPDWQWQNNQPQVTPAGGLARFLATGRRPDLRVDDLAMLWQIGGRDRPNVVATPLMQVLVAKERCAAYMGLQFGDVVSAGLSAWAEMMLALPPELRGADPSTLESLAQGLGQAQLNEAAAWVGAGFGAAASLATTVIPQPYGAIVGAVIAIIGAIVTALMGAAYDVGLARPDRPPCPASPLLRNIVDPSTGACDFDAARRGVEEVLGKSSVVAMLAGEGVLDPGAWMPALEALSARPLEDEAPVLPPPDERRATPTWKYVAGGLGVGAGLLLLGKLFLP